MGIKEIRGRTLPGRSEEPASDGPTGRALPAVSGSEQARGATQHPRDDSAFEAPRPRAPAAPAQPHVALHTTSAFDTSPHVAVRAEELDDGLFTAVDEREEQRGQRDPPAPEPRELDDDDDGDSAPPELWSDGYDPTATRGRVGFGAPPPSPPPRALDLQSAPTIEMPAFVLGDAAPTIEMPAVAIGENTDLRTATTLEIPVVDED